MGLLVNPYQYAIIVPADRLADASLLAVALLGVAPEVASTTFSIPLGVDGVITHYGGCGVIGDSVSEIKPNIPAWADYFRWTIDGKELVSSSKNAPVGDAWSWDASIAFLGLVVIN